ncbi:MAG TPA: UDP-N-acetylmuramate dehydrogenase [Thermoanaerobaculia bacterium]|nr:UDP-N-acetylmuramate dehydrogenase [Thermoanaerobaculia bacterium]
MTLSLAPDEGEVRENEPLARHTTLRIGGPAERFVVCRTAAALGRTVCAAREEGKPFRILGKGSNVLVADAGLPGFVATLDGELLETSIDGDVVVAGGGASLGGVCAKAARAGLSGLEPISGIPSSIGGAVRINAGAYGGEIFDVLESVTLLGSDGAVFERPAAGIAHGYRWTSLVQTGEIVCRARMRLARAPAEAIEARTREVTEKRRGALPSQPNAGSVFKNPPGRFAGKLLEECGLKGARSGDAEISERHANVIVNRGGARAADVLELMRLMRRSVLDRFGIELEPEVELLGLPWP